jgi:glycosyltransferase involved in cell wall biosynthesis
MKVAMDIRTLLATRAGTYTYTFELLQALIDLGVDVSMWFASRRFVSGERDTTPDVEALRERIPLLVSPASNLILYSYPGHFLWRNFTGALSGREWFPADIDVYHATFWPAPLEARKASVLTVYDLLSLPHPEWGTKYLMSCHRTIAAMAPKYDHIIAISEATRQQLLEYSRVDPEKVSVIHLGVGQEWRRPPSEEYIVGARGRYHLQKPYLLYVGNQDPRKNLERVVDAYDRLCEENGANWDLVMIGPRAWSAGAQKHLFDRPRKGRVRRLGFIPRQDVIALTASASGLILASLMEGFGLPIVEAMSVGCPVITSNVSCMPEVAGDAALLVDPTDTAAIADSMKRLLTDEALAADLRERGRARAAGFTWEENARRTLEVYEKVAR